MHRDTRLYIIVVTEFPPGQTGGIAHWAYNLYKTLRESGKRVVVLTKKTAHHKKHNRISDETVVTIKGHDWNKFGWFYVFPKLLPLLLANRNSIVITATWRNAVVLHRFRKVLNFTLFCSARGTDITKTVHPPGRKEQKLMRRVLKDVDILIPISRFLDTLVRNSFSELAFRSVIIGNDVNHNLFKPAESREQKYELRAKLGIDPDTPLLITVARMEPFKGLPDLIDTLPAVIAAVPGMTLLMISAIKPPEFQKIHESIVRNQLSKHVLILPPVEHEELPSLYQAADAFVLWSKAVYEPVYQEEGFGRTAIEAAACGLPVVVSDTGGQPETVIDGKTGYIVPSGNKALLAERLISLLTDHDLATRMGIEGRQFIENTYTSEIMKNKILDLASKKLQVHDIKNN